MMITCCLVLIFTVALPGPATADSIPESEIDQRFSRHYYGMHVDWDLSMDFDEPVRSFISSHYLSAGFSYGYGRTFFRPRARLSAGWLREKGFALSAGAELPIVEILSPAQTKLFGLYVTADYGFAFGQDGGGFYRFSPYFRFPVTPVVGVMIGATYSSESAWTLFMGRSIGAYPMKQRNKTP